MVLFTIESVHKVLTHLTLRSKSSTVTVVKIFFVPLSFSLSFSVLIEPHTHQNEAQQKKKREKEERKIYSHIAMLTNDWQFVSATAAAVVVVNEGNKEYIIMNCAHESDQLLSSLFNI